MVSSGVSVCLPALHSLPVSTFNNSNCLNNTDWNLGFDGVLHLSNEMKDAPKKVPTSMVLGVLINSVLAFGFVLTLLFFMGDPITALMSPTGYPVIEIYLQATGSVA